MMDFEFRQDLAPRIPNIHPTQSKEARIYQAEPGVWSLDIPAGPKGRYRLAQLDDYEGLRRANFPWQPPVSFQVRARASSNEISGTWGFGLWNDPFSMGVLSGVEMLRLPALPNAAWFFFASPQNYLSLRDDLPASGGLAATFRSPRWPPPLLALGALGLPFLPFPPAVRLFRRLGRRVVQQDAASMSHDATEWHDYSLEWETERVRLRLDEGVILDTPISPIGPLGLVLWVDNQYAALSPAGRVSFGILPTSQPAHIEIAELTMYAGK